MTTRMLIAAAGLAIATMAGGVACEARCDPTCANDVFVSATFVATWSTLAGGTITVCLNDVCQASPIDATPSAASADDALSFRAGLAPRSDLCCGPVGVLLQVHAVAYGALHDGDTWTVRATTADGTTVLNAARSVTYGDVYGCDGIACRQASVTIP